MPHHVHTPPQCGFWTGHDPSCFDQQFGAEVDCILIEVGKNKGNYMCIHHPAPVTDGGRSGFGQTRSGFVERYPDRQLDFGHLYPQETLQIRQEITPGVRGGNCDVSNP